jgi:hypothetical protein
MPGSLNEEMARQHKSPAPFRRATGKGDHVAGGKPFIDEAEQNGFVVGSDAEWLRAAAASSTVAARIAAFES